MGLLNQLKRKVMKISERNCPLLKYLKWDKPLMEHKDAIRDKFLLPIEIAGQSDAKWVCKTIYSSWQFWTHGFSSKIDVVSAPFDKAVTEVKSSLLSLNSNKEYPSSLIGATILPYRGLTVCYNLTLVEGQPAYSGTILSMSKNGDLYTFLSADNKGIPIQSYVDRSLMKVSGSGYVSDEDYHGVVMQIPLLYHLFKKYAKIETRVINRKSRSKNPNGEKDINETDFDLNYVDCTWFTNIVRSEGFKVRGHFRLQPKKDEYGEWTKELIYINEFKKNGYSRRAKMLINEETPAE